MGEPPCCRWYAFDELGAFRLYRLLGLRSEVFVVEQRCVWQDIDGRDPVARHLLIETANGEIEGYARVMPPDREGGPARIGRVIVAKPARSRGLARSLVSAAIAKIRDEFPGRAIELSAQAYLEGFYRSFGFEPTGDLYLEDGIAHIDMRLDR